MKAREIISWILRVAIAVILLQSLYFKFSGAAESVYVFSTVGHSVGLEKISEPYGRFAVGFFELVAAVGLFIPGFLLVASVLTVVIGWGAVSAHLFTGLGIEVMNDGGLLFGMALFVLLGGAALWFMNAKKYRKRAEKKIEPS